jgi:transglutaminase-like putative cysteine protease
LVTVCGTGCADAPSLPLLEWDASARAPRHVFLWSDPASEYLTRLRKTYALEEQVAGSTSDFERVRVICHWVHGLWRHDGNNVPAQFDPIFIITQAQQGQRFRCVEYGIVIAGCLKALGIPARVLGLKTSDVETRASGAGHVVAEAYLRDEGRWVMVDGQFDAVPVLGARPLSAVELQQALATSAPGLTVASLSQVDAPSYFGWVGEYLYYLDAQLDQRGPGVDTELWTLMLVPIGAPQPTAFQGRSGGPYFLFTDALADFYPVPTY